MSPQELAKFYLGLQAGLFVDMAAQTAAAIQGLNPKINVWNTGAAGGSHSPAVCAADGCTVHAPAVSYQLAG